MFCCSQIIVRRHLPAPHPVFNSARPPRHFFHSLLYECYFLAVAGTTVELILFFLLAICTLFLAISCRPWALYACYFRASLSVPWFLYQMNFPCHLVRKRSVGLKLQSCKDDEEADDDLKANRNVPRGLTRRFGRELLITSFNDSNIDTVIAMKPWNFSVMYARVTISGDVL